MGNKTKTNTGHLCEKMSAAHRDTKAGRRTTVLTKHNCVCLRVSAIKTYIARLARLCNKITYRHCGSLFVDVYMRRQFQLSAKYRKHYLRF